MKRWIKRLYVAGLILCPVSYAQADPETHAAGGWMCPCPGGEKPMGGAANCQEACFGKSGSSSSSSGGGSTPQDQILMQGAAALGRAIGESLRGNPEEDAKRQAEQSKRQADQAKRQADQAKAIEQQRQAEELRRADEQRQQELAKQRILGLLKGAEPSTGLSLKMGDSDAPLTVTEKRGMFGSTEVKPTGIDSPPAEHGLQLKLGDDADRSSMQARKGFDTAGKIMGSDLPPPPPRTPTSKSSAEKSQLLNTLKSKLKKNEAEEKSLKDQLAQLQKSPTPDPVAISQVQEKIVVKEKEKKKIMLDLTAEDTDAQGSNQSSHNTNATSTGAATKGATH